jgi:hypothetical protein
LFSTSELIQISRQFFKDFVSAHPLPPPTFCFLGPAKESFANALKTHGIELSLEDP